MKIADIGPLAALKLLLPHFVVAGRLACRIQDDIARNGNHQRDVKSGDRFTEALTDADIAIETFLGAILLTTFEDIAFYGEEHERDRVSRYFHSDAPYLVTLDPIDGTLYFKDGLPIFSIILTLCVGMKIVASLVHEPRRGRFSLATADDGAFATTDGDVEAGRPLAPFTISERGKVVLLGKDWFDRKLALEAAGFEIANPSSDYDGSKEWSRTSLRMLTGEVVGAAFPAAQLIDAGAIAFIVARAGGKQSAPAYDPETKRTANFVCATSSATYDRLTAALSGR